MPLLTRNAFSPRLLSQDLHGIVKPDFIRKQIRAGKLKARRFGGKSLIIMRADAEAWLAGLPSASEPTNLGGSRGKRAQSNGKAKVKTAQEAALGYLHGRRMASHRASRERS